METTDEDAILEVDKIHTYYGDSYVLQGLSVQVPRRGVTAILGRNGMGKTTLVRSIMGLTPPRTGSIRFQGQDIGGLPPYRISRAGVALVPQGRRLFTSLSVHENLALVTSRLRGARPRSSEQPEWTVQSVLDLFPQLAERRKQAAGTLSGGEQQMLAIARALLNNPKLLLMDEPSEGLSPVMVDQVRVIVDELATRGYAIVLVEQRYDLAMSLASAVYVMAGGQVVYEGDPRELDANSAVKSEHLGI